MERLTQWIDENRAIPRVDLRRCGHERCMTQLARYEDTGLTPEEIIQMKEKNTEKAPIHAPTGYGKICSVCLNMVQPWQKYCGECGQRLK